MIGLLKFLFLDRRARRSLAAEPAAKARPAKPAGTSSKRERTPAEALAEAEERMKRLPPEKAQLVRAAMAVHRARQSALADLSDDDLRRLQDTAEKAFFGGGKSG